MSYANRKLMYEQTKGTARCPQRLKDEFENEPVKEPKEPKFTPEVEDEIPIGEPKKSKNK
jgi:hypothetical protein